MGREINRAVILALHKEIIVQTYGEVKGIWTVTVDNVDTEFYYLKIEE